MTYVMSHPAQFGGMGWPSWPESETLITSVDLRLHGSERLVKTKSPSTLRNVRRPAESLGPGSGGWRVRQLSSHSAMLSQLPCLGV